MPKKEDPTKSWPAEARNLYTPLRALGTGGFGAVWLASNKQQQQQEDQSDPLQTNSNKYVAIKLVGHPSCHPINDFTKISESGYFHRECEVLSEISHRHIVKLLNKIELKADERESIPEASPYCMVLQYCRGPTVDQMLKHGGALGIYLAREVAAQLIDAVSFLHGRGVIHRDIKPDNILVGGAKLEGLEACWSDDADGDEEAKKRTWNIMLIDFGFARPLHPDDIAESKLQNNNANKPEPHDQFFGRSNIDGVLKHREIKEKDCLSLSTSQSHKKIRGLSAVGNRNYAAPEMLKGMRNFKKKLFNLSSSSGKLSKEEKKKQMHEQSLANAISDYGMTADAYSVGTTLRFMLTGVPPDVAVNDFLSSKNSAMSKFGRSLKKSLGKDKDKRKKRYKPTSALPREAAKVVLGLTHWNEVTRTTVRSARNYEWIKSSHTTKDEISHPSSNDHHGKIDFLKCALERKV